MKQYQLTIDNKVVTDKDGIVRTWSNKRQAMIDAQDIGATVRACYYSGWINPADRFEL